MPGNNAKFTEIKRDNSTDARTGLLTLNGYKIQTPVLWIGHSFYDPVRYWKETRLKFPGLLVNACQILNKPHIAQSISKRGLDNFLSYDGPIMMDSGGFLFQKNKRMNVKPDTIVELYKETKIDIGVVLDHPLNPSLSKYRNKRRWERTLRNTETMMKAGGTFEFMPVVHGYTINDLKSACRQLRSILGEPTLIGIGSLVPLLKTSHLDNGFRYLRGNGKNGDHVTFISDALRLVRDEFPSSFLHVFGVGGTTTILPVFALGADSVDSVAWRLKAAYGAIQLPGISDRFLSDRPNSPKTRRVIEEREAPILANCGCPVCSDYRYLGWQKKHLDNSFEARATHNGWVFLEEIRSFRKAVSSGKGHKLITNRLSNGHRFYGIFR